ncbi:hypothetical protein HN371_05975 [Candidatus Poribacteria bacterium]|nr:hypothetical protein [Candidatus Poribacteria bacterium]MBT5537095.1 hypothetical protein [Candidatus Poribacteria bacterium]MBT5713660.1 hypothetical protein [Candidatus Poribacteria bacterium]MBT7098436.1 hypothetical protein [Candidatus Poribacteria bacterium]MBT7805419.1 hypothetical protein [Candidatus Poribacteria bacterium]
MPPITAVAIPEQTSDYRLAHRGVGGDDSNDLGERKVSGVYVHKPAAGAHYSMRRGIVVR